MHTQNHSARSWTLLGTLYTPPESQISHEDSFWNNNAWRILVDIEGDTRWRTGLHSSIKGPFGCYNWLLFIIVLTTIYVTENFKGYFQIVICQLHLRLCHILYIQYSHFGLYLIYSYKNFSPTVVELGNRFLVTFLYSLQYLL